eukprot:gnl/TRDRNA2_/TRDRNA2_40045_c0_seq2.p1 gnl/TRDRNA2_/TRDRNA2_40045_c0~~gnl/TRDRNA2_/TRDRNA2_40045_c0_seq2.p1  ORF type:complete len:371 (+),score=56.97 gnl/TRDRNA2_/TRDRNA2_40045_c0_seq2:97-1209(+)
MVCVDSTSADSTTGAADGPLDAVALAINRLLADERLVSLELPRMLTAEQRKRAKQLIERHPELSCESYGFGSDRVMHVFRRSSTRVDEAMESVEGRHRVLSWEAVGAVSLKVKNTFIDDVVNFDDTGIEACDSPNILFRSLPARLPHGMPWRRDDSCVGSAKRSGPFVLHLPGWDASPIAKGSVSSLFRDEKCGHGHVHPSPSPACCSTSASSGNESGGGSPASSSRGERSPEDDAVRATAAWGAAWGAAPTFFKMQPPPTASAASPGDENLLASGTEVVIEGLLKCPDFNGKHAVVQSFDVESGRYSVLLSSSSTACSQQSGKVKRSNLRLLSLNNHCGLAPNGALHTEAALMTSTLSQESDLHARIGN